MKIRINPYLSLSAGGKVEIAMADMFWEAYYGMFKDKFGITWMVSFDKNTK